MYFLRHLVVCLFVFHCSGHCEEENLAFHEVVQQTVGFEILLWDGEHSDLIENGCIIAAERFNESDFIDSTSIRVNELGAKMEQCVAAGLHHYNIDCSIPLDSRGRINSSGYPDLRMILDDQVYYIEVKVFSSHTRDSTFRTFYYSQNQYPKINEDAFHILVGFEICINPKDEYEIVGFDVCDLRNLPCKVKLEYNSNNKTMYGDQFGFRRSLKLKSQQ